MLIETTVKKLSSAWPAYKDTDRISQSHLPFLYMRKADFILILIC